MKAPRGDIDRIMEVMERAFDPAYGEAWNRRQIEDSLSFPSNRYCLVNEFGAEPAEDEKAAGFYLSRSGFLEEELLLLAVVPEFRGRGLGRILIDNLTESSRDRGAQLLFLEMRRGNPAEALYSACGFERIGERRNYYRGADGSRIDAITFGLKLK